MIYFLMICKIMLIRSLGRKNVDDELADLFGREVLKNSYINFGKFAFFHLYLELTGTERVNS